MPKNLQTSKKENTLANVNPALSSEWHPKNNGVLTPGDVTTGSHRKVWWLCPTCGYSWIAEIKSRANGNGCPACSGHAVWSGHNDLQTTNPDLASEWDYSKNGNLRPEMFTSGSSRRVWWKCNTCGFEWENSISERNRRKGKCPLCSNKILIKGKNDLRTVFPKLLEEWDWEGNSPINPEDVTFGSAKKVSWKCKNCGFIWKASVSSRTYGKTGCPACANNKIVIKGRNDLASMNSALLSEWNYEKNSDISPDSISYTSNKKVWWRCSKCGGEWKAKVSNRNRGRGCPICSGRKIVAGINDMASAYPELASEWDYELNGKLLPNEVARTSSKKVWWKCKACGYQWQAMISSRTSGNKTGCPKCALGTHSSLPEQIIYYYVKQSFNDAINGYRPIWLNGEIDVYIPRLKVGIEYDGEHWHQNVAKDIEKNDTIKEHGIRIIRIREPKCPMFYADCEQIQINNLDSNYDYMGSVVTNIFKIINMWYETAACPDIDISKDLYKVIDSFETSKTNKSVATIAPQLIDEWNYEKNCGLIPDKLTFGSHKKVWWKCSTCGFEWNAIVKDRVNGIGCPACAGIVAVKGINDLATLNPKVASEWDYEKNADLTPDMIKPGSHKSVWWKCSTCGFEWKSVIRRRSMCPNCKRDKKK